MISPTTWFSKSYRWGTKVLLPALISAWLLPGCTEQVHTIQTKAGPHQITILQTGQVVSFISGADTISPLSLGYRHDRFEIASQKAIKWNKGYKWLMLHQTEPLAVHLCYDTTKQTFLVDFDGRHVVNWDEEHLTKTTRPEEVIWQFNLNGTIREHHIISADTTSQVVYLVNWPD